MNKTTSTTSTTTTQSPNGGMRINSIIHNKNPTIATTPTKSASISRIISCMHSSTLLDKSLYEEMNSVNSSFEEVQNGGQYAMLPPPPPLFNGVNLRKPSFTDSPHTNKNVQKESNLSLNTESNGTVRPGIVASSSQQQQIQPQGEVWARLRLVGEACSDAPPEFLLSETKIIIGRGLNSHVKIVADSMSKFVSRTHADIVKMNDYTFLLTDLASTNGTLLNGKKIGSNVDLKHNDLIIITGGVRACIGEYIVLENGKKRSDFSTEQEWKCALISTVKNAFMYKFEMLQTQNIAKNLNPTKTAIRLKTEEEEDMIEVPKLTQQENPLIGKRGREESESVEFESDYKKIKETNEKWTSFSSESSNEFNCVICCNLMVEPTILECGHSFCRKCLHDWLSKNKSCPVCRKKLSHSSAPNRALETILKSYLEKCSTEEESKEFEERIKAVKLKDDEDFAKFVAMVENARAKKIKFLNITARWKLEEKRTFKNGVKQYFGKCRDEFCKLVGITETFVNSCSNEQLLIACENLELPVTYMIVGQEIKTMRRVVDFDETKQTLFNFWKAKDNLY